MAKTYAEINRKIKEGKAVVVTAEEIIDIVEKDGLKKTAERIDVVDHRDIRPDVFKRRLF